MTKNKKQRIRQKRLKGKIRNRAKAANAANARLYWTKYERLISFDRTYARCMCPNKLYFGPLSIKYPNRKRVRQLAKCLKQGMHYRARIPKRFLYEYKAPVMVNRRSTYCSILGSEIATTDTKNRAFSDEEIETLKKFFPNVDFSHKEAVRKK